MFPTAVHISKTLDHSIEIIIERPNSYTILEVYSLEGEDAPCLPRERVYEEVQYFVRPYELKFLQDAWRGK